MSATLTREVERNVLKNKCYDVSKEMDEEKVRWELHKNAAYCFEQILEAAHYKIAAVRPLTSFLTNLPSKMGKTYWRRKDELINNVLLWTPTHGHTNVGQSLETYSLALDLIFRTYQK